MKTNKILLILLLMFTCGCATQPIPPLKESEVPYRLKAGIYTDFKNNNHVVSDDFPRWSVSEAYLYDSIVDLNNKTTKPTNKSLWVYLLVFLCGSGIVWIFKKSK